MSGDIIRLLEAKEDAVLHLDYRKARSSVEWGIAHGLISIPKPEPERPVNAKHSLAIKKGYQRAKNRRMKGILK